MINIENKENCTSCFACYNICPVKAIEMVENSEGFKYPKVNRDKCIKCGLCDRICPVINNKNKEGNSEKPKVIAAYTKDNFIRLDSTSGGAFSEIAKKVYKRNGYVCGAIYNKEWGVEHLISNDIKDLENLRSSKYLQSDINDIFSQIKKLLENGKEILICGSPCQIAGLTNFLQKDYPNLYTLDFICRGMNSPKIFKGYVKYLEDKYKSKAKRIKFKHKIHGWHNFSTKIDFENGKSYIGGRYEDSYMRGYLKFNAFMRPSCYKCKFKGLPRRADITLADFWGIERINPKMDQNKGTSMIYINSEKGQRIFDEIKENIIYEEIPSEEAFKENISMKESVEMTKERKGVFENIDKLSYKELSDKYFPEPSMVQRIKIRMNNNKAMVFARNIKRRIVIKMKGS